MNLEGILSIAGKPGLFKMISQAKNTIVVESLIDKKRMPLYASHQVSALEDIGMFWDLPNYDEQKYYYFHAINFSGDTHESNSFNFFGIWSYAI